MKKKKPFKAVSDYIFIPNAKGTRKIHPDGSNYTITWDNSNIKQKTFQALSSRKQLKEMYDYLVKHSPDPVELHQEDEKKETV